MPLFYSDEGSPITYAYTSSHRVPRGSYTHVSIYVYINGTYAGVSSIVFSDPNPPPPPLPICHLQPPYEVRNHINVQYTGCQTARLILQDPWNRNIWYNGSTHDVSDWYWQTSPKGESTALHALSNPTLQRGQTYWLRTLNDFNCWKGAVAYTIGNSTVPNPSNLTKLGGNICGGPTTLIYPNTLPNGITLTWRKEATSQTYGQGPSITILGNGNYYAEISDGICTKITPSVSVTYRPIPARPFSIPFSGNALTTTSNCGSTTLSISGNINTIKAPGVNWYWQTSPTGTSLSHNAANPYTVAQEDSYYLRAEQNGCWSEAVSNSSYCYKSP